MTRRQSRVLATALRWFDRQANSECGPYPDFEVSERVRVAVLDGLHDFNGKGVAPISVIWGAARALREYIEDHQL